MTKRMLLLIGLCVAVGCSSGVRRIVEPSEPVTQRPPPRGEIPLDHLLVTLEKGTVIFPLADDGYPVKGEVDREQIAFTKQGNELAALLDELGWTAMRKVLHQHHEGQAEREVTFVRGDIVHTQTVTVSEFRTRRYVVFFGDNEDPEWLAEAKDELEELSVIDAVEYSGYFYAFD